jgi:hypothetical protein
MRIVLDSCHSYIVTYTSNSVSQFVLYNRVNTTLANQIKVR